MSPAGAMLCLPHDRDVGRRGEGLPFGLGSSLAADTHTGVQGEITLNSKTPNQRPNASKAK